MVNEKSAITVFVAYYLHSNSLSLEATLFGFSKPAKASISC
jgi:hypothetical protein